MPSGGGNRKRGRSRSPTKKRDGYNKQDKNNLAFTNNMPMGNMPMMMNNMYQQNGMVPGMAAGMYPNMMMQGSMMGSTMMQPADMMASSGMDLMTQQPMDVASMGSNTNTPTGSMDMNMMGGMMMDPSMMGMGNMANMSNISMYPMASESPVFEKKEIVLKHCKLTPGSTDQTQRNRPPGCRTIFVGGLPEKIKESIVRDIFERFGRIHTLRLSKKNFCHIRYDRETSADSAINMSGYKVKLLDKEKEDAEEEEDTPANSGWLHVDYAMSRDDQNEYERKQRQALRIQQQQMQALAAQQEMMGGSKSINMEMGLAGGGRLRHRSPSPKVQPFSNSTIVQLMEKIKSEDYFSSNLPTLLAWLERGECSKKNANQFYSMIQATNSHIRRLYNEKTQSEEELQETRERVKQKIARVIELLEQVAQVFTAATHQRVWDHFTKSQRKNIESWQKMTQEFNILRDEFNEKFNNEEKDNDNGMGNAACNSRHYYSYGAVGANTADNGDASMLKLENDSLKFQLEAYKNEVAVLKAEAAAELEKFKAQFIARQALQGAFDKNPPLPKPLSKPPPPPPLPGDAAAAGAPAVTGEVEPGCGEAKLIGVISAFLQVHPQGASLDYVSNYVRGALGGAAAERAPRVLRRHADVFRRTTRGVGAAIEHRWHFVAFRPAEHAAHAQHAEHAEHAAPPESEAANSSSD